MSQFHSAQTHASLRFLLYFIRFFTIFFLSFVRCVAYIELYRFFRFSICYFIRNPIKESHLINWNISLKMFVFNYYFLPFQKQKLVDHFSCCNLMIWSIRKCKTIKPNWCIGSARVKCMLLLFYAFADETINKILVSKRKQSYCFTVQSPYTAFTLLWYGIIDGSIWQINLLLSNKKMFISAHWTYVTFLCILSCQMNINYTHF